MMILVGPLKLSIFNDFMINSRNLMLLDFQVLVGESCQAEDQKGQELVLGGSLFCLQLLVIGQHCLSSV